MDPFGTTLGRFASADNISFNKKKFQYLWGSGKRAEKKQIKKFEFELTYMTPYVQVQGFVCLFLTRAPEQ